MSLFCFVSVRKKMLIFTWACNLVSELSSNTDHFNIRYQYHRNHEIGGHDADIIIHLITADCNEFPMNVSGPLKCHLNWFSVKYVKKMKTSSKWTIFSIFLGIFYVLNLCVHKLWCKCPSLGLANATQKRRHRFNIVWAAKFITCFVCVSYVKCTYVRERRKSVRTRKERERATECGQKVRIKRATWREKEKKNRAYHRHTKYTYTHLSATLWSRMLL